MSQRAGRGVRRAIDLCLSILLLVMLSPLLLGIAVVVKLTSAGPVLYSQERVGLGGRTFHLYKFRSMRVDAERETGPVWAGDVDPRCTWLGQLMRRFGIDELPQLWNVARGDMSLVGPRPERPFFVHKFSQIHAHYPSRHQVLPGITGWAQVNGWRGNTSLERRLEFDLQYVERPSLALYAYILVMTPLALLFPPRRSGDES